jgi:hypothetical protein
MCVDYTNLNKHCPKDPFGLPHLDEVIDSTTGCELLSFLDCYYDYHQISLREEDQIKTSYYYAFRCLLLHDHVVWAQKRRHNLPTGHPIVPQGSDQRSAH